MWASLFALICIRFARHWSSRAGEGSIRGTGTLVVLLKLRNCTSVSRRPIVSRRIPLPCLRGRVGSYADHCAGSLEVKRRTAPGKSER